MLTILAFGTPAMVRLGLHVRPSQMCVAKQLAQSGRQHLFPLHVSHKQLTQLVGAVCTFFLGGPLF